MTVVSVITECGVGDGGSKCCSQYILQELHTGYVLTTGNSPAYPVIIPVPAAVARRMST